MKVICIKELKSFRMSNEGTLLIVNKIYDVLDCKNEKLFLIRTETGWKDWISKDYVTPM